MNQIAVKIKNRYKHQLTAVSRITFILKNYLVKNLSIASAASRPEPIARTTKLAPK
jgi:hypothetical protein